MTKVKKCFVIMPFDPAYDIIYNNAIEPAASKFYLCERSDNPLKFGDIIKSLISRIFDADIIIADISNSNPNVFYELGIAHTVSNTVIVICEKTKTPIPFDLNTFTILYYDKTTVGVEKLKGEITNVIKNLDEITVEPTNPVQLFRPIKYQIPLLDQAALERRYTQILRENTKLKLEKKEKSDFLEKMVAISSTMIALTSTTEHEQNIIKLLSQEKPSNYKKHDSFVKELRHLRSLKLITTNNEIKLTDLPESGDLKDYITLTPLGLRYIKLMELKFEIEQF